MLPRPLWLLPIAALAVSVEPVPAVADDAASRARVADLARTYAGALIRVGGGWKAAPELCSAPPPSRVLISAADDGTPHARKVYRLYVKEEAAYTAHAAADQPIGQAIVKEAHAPREVASGEGERARSADGQYAAIIGEAPARLGDRWYLGGELTALFVMLKIGAADAPGTDAGWIYATVAADRSTITAIGSIDECMRCHADAPRDRVFGLQRSQDPPPPRIVPVDRPPADR